MGSGLLRIALMFRHEFTICFAGVGCELYVVCWALLNLASGILVALLADEEVLCKFTAELAKNAEKENFK
jgi:hypothetical protein